MGKIAKPAAGGGSRVKLTVILTASDSKSLAGQAVEITDAATGAAVASINYAGQPETVKVPAGLSYKISAGERYGYVTPDTVQGVALDDKSVLVTFTACRRLGFARAKANSAAAARITYLFDAAGYTPAAMNLSTGVMNYGSWEDFVNEVACPVMVKLDGTEDYELNRDDQTKRADGSASDISNSAYEGNAMVRFSGKWKWVKRYEDASNEYVIFADGRYDETYHAYAHTDATGTVRDCFYWGMYKGSNVSSKLRSLADRGVMVSQTRNTEVAYAQACGEGWDTIYKSGWEYIADLLTLIGKTDDSQGAFGYGHCASGNTAAISTGSLKAKGAFWGSSNQTSDVKVFWIEGAWGNIWEGMRGLINAAGVIKTKMVPPYNFDGTGYFNTGKVPGGTSGGYISGASVTDEAGWVPVTASGSATTYYCDGYWYNNGQTDYALVGGRWASGLLVGSRYVTLSNTAANATTDIGSRLSFVPQTAA